MYIKKYMRHMWSGRKSIKWQKRLHIHDDGDEVKGIIFICHFLSLLSIFFGQGLNREESFYVGYLRVICIVYANFIFLWIYVKVKEQKEVGKIIHEYFRITHTWSFSWIHIQHNNIWNCPTWPENKIICWIYVV